jgi:hypothetical protein
MQLTGTGGTTALTDTKLGTITLPAGGPWKIFGLWGYAVTNAAGAAEATFGHIRVESESGDVTPNPAPSRFPLAGVPSYLGAATGKPLVPVTIWDVDWDAEGKAIISLHYINECAKTAGDVATLGLIFGKSIPEWRPARFCDRVTAAFLTAGSNAVGTITLAEKATRIVGIGAQVVQNMVSTATQEILPFFTMTSDDVDFAPSQWPCSFASCVGLATNHGLNNAIPPVILTVDIPIIGGARIDCAINLLAATTTNVQGQVFILYE